MRAYFVASMIFGNVVTFTDAVHVNFSKGVGTVMASFGNKQHTFRNLEFIAKGGNGAVFSGYVDDDPNLKAIKFGMYTWDGTQQEKITTDLVAKLRSESPVMFDGSRMVLASKTESANGDVSKLRDVFMEESDTFDKKWGKKNAFTPAWFQLQDYIEARSAEDWSNDVINHPDYINANSKRVALKAALRTLQVCILFGLSGVGHHDLHMDNVLLEKIDKTSTQQPSQFFSLLTPENTKVKIIDLDTMSEAECEKTNCKVNARDVFVDFGMVKNFVSLTVEKVWKGDSNFESAWELAKIYADCVANRVSGQTQFQYTFQGVQSDDMTLSIDSDCMKNGNSDDAFESWSVQMDLIKEVTKENGPPFGSLIGEKVTEILRNRS